MNKLCSIAIVMTAGLSGAVTSASPPAAGAISYQGQLNETGESAAGPVDLRFTLFNSETSGTQVGVLAEHLNVNLDDGRRRAYERDFSAFAARSRRRAGVCQST